MLIKIENGSPVGHPLVEQNFRQLFSNVSFPQVIKASDVEPYDYGLFAFSDKPSAGRYQKVEETTARKMGDTWVQQWAVVEMSAAERNDVDATKVNSVRNARNTLLSMSDWTQVADAPVDSQAWAVYRQSLRDVTSQPGFPWDVTWPTKPE